MPSDPLYGPLFKAVGNTKLSNTSPFLRKFYLRAAESQEREQQLYEDITHEVGKKTVDNMIRFA